MAFMTILIAVSLVAMANSLPGFMPNQRFAGFPGLPMSYVYLPPLPTPPSIPGGPTPLPLPTPPPLLWFGKPPKFDNFPTFPTAEDILSNKPKQGQYYNGVYVNSKLNTRYDKDGKPISTGDATVIENQNGNVTETRIPFGNSQPKPESDTFSSFHNFEQPDFFESAFDFGPKNIRDYVPSKDEHFSGTSVSSHSYSANNNGVKSGGGGFSHISNINGAVEETVAEFETK